MSWPDPGFILSEIGFRWDELNKLKLLNEFAGKETELSRIVSQDIKAFTDLLMWMENMMINIDQNWDSHQREKQDKGQEFVRTGTTGHFTDNNGRAYPAHQPPRQFAQMRPVRKGLAA